MDFVPEIVDGSVILNAIEICSHGSDCRPCSELAVGIHNWLITHKLRYLVVDFQDEKEVCSTILTELLQLQKRLRFPFLFCGMMEEPKKLLLSYAYTDYKFFSIPEDSIAFLKQNVPQVLAADLQGIKIAEPIPCTRSRTYKIEEAEEGDPEEADPEPEV